MSHHPSSAGGPTPARHADFDTVVDRRSSDSIKWDFYGEEVLPMWVADMDFASPAPIVEALQQRVAEGVFGYGKDPADLRQVLVARLARLYNWQIEPEHIVFLPGLVCGLNVVARAVGEPGSGVLVNTPVYPPFLSASINQQRTVQVGPLAAHTKHDPQGRPYLHYELDFDTMEAAITPETRLFMLCNPHNPVGRAYTPQELSQIGDFCLRHNLIISSDEIHCDLLLGDAKHHPIAALSPELSERTITLMAPSKTYNIPGLGCSIAIVPNAELRSQINQAASGIVPHVNILGMVAAHAAYAHCEDWLDELRAYLTANRDLVFDFVQRRLPQVSLTLPEATYLAWLDLRGLGLDTPYKFVLKEAKVALGDGAGFGQGGEGFVRLNFGTPRTLLQQGLDQIAAALAHAIA